MTLVAEWDTNGVLSEYYECLTCGYIQWASQVMQSAVDMDKCYQCGVARRKHRLSVLEVIERLRRTKNEPVRVVPPQVVPVIPPVVSVVPPAAKPKPASGVLPPQVQRPSLF